MDSNSYERILQNSRLLRVSGLLLSLTLLGAAFYSSPLIELFSMVLRREESSHGLFVPLLSLYFVWHKRSALSEIGTKYEFVRGSMVVTGGFLLFSLARIHDYFFWECFSFIVVLSGLVLCFLGKDWFKEISFPIFFLISMIPISEHLYDTMAGWLRQATIMTSTELLALVGVPVLREDLLIHLPNTALNINIGCSGIRYLLSYFVFGIAYAYLFRTRFNQRIFAVCLTIPISLLASTLRLIAIALLAYYIGPHIAQYWPHVIISWLVFFSVLVLFVTFDQWLMSRKRRDDHRLGNPCP
jgi:exosortase